MEENQPKRAKPNDIVLSGAGGHDHELLQEIIEEIIVRLPAKSVVRFKSVCRQWFNMISDLDLPEVSFQQSLSKLRLVYWIQNPSGRSAHDVYSYCLFKLDERGTKAKKEATLPLQDVGNHCHWIYLSCDSLLLFQGNGDNFYVYDTIPEQQTLLSEIPIDQLHERIRYFSMIHDASKGNYKVVVFVQREIRGIMLFLYDLNPREWWREGKWRKSKPPFSQVMFDDFSIVVQGVLFWIADAPDPVDYNCFIQPMEIATETFMKRIEPPCQPVEESVMYQLLELKGSLCLMHAAFGDELNIWVWVLKDPVQSFWNKQYNISCSSIEPDLSYMVAPFSYYDFLNVSFVHLTVGSHVLVTIFQEPYWFNLDTEQLSKITVEDNPAHSLHSIIKY